VLWVHASNTARLEQSYQEIAELVKVRGRKDPQADVYKLVHDWLRDEKNGRWLLVLDNADDAAVLSPQTSNGQRSQADDGSDSNDSSDGNSSALRQQLSRYLPPSRHGSVLVTSRTRRAAMQVVEDSDIILIEPMDNAAAHTLLYKKLGDKGNKPGKDDGIAELAVALDYMPLALVQAAAYIRERRPRCSVQQYLKEYRQSDSRKTSLLNQGAGHLRRDEAASNAILITWQISFDHVRRTRPSATDLLSLMSFFDRQGIPEALLRSQGSNTENEQVLAVGLDDGFEDDVLTLQDYSFITVTADEKMFEMHGLVQLATRKWLESQEQLNKWREQFISNLCAELPTGQHENWEKCQALFPHARAAIAQRPASQKSLEEWALLLFKAAWYAWQTGRAGEAENMSVMSMEVRRKVLGEESEETLSSMGMVGLARSFGGKYKEAEAMHKQTLATTKKVLGHEHPDTLTSMNNLALVLDSQGKYEEAEAMHRQTLATTEKVLGHEHPDTLTSMNNLAFVLDRQGKYEEAEAMHKQTLATTEKVLGHEHPSTLTSMNNLAGVLDRQGKYEEAEAMHKQTLATREKVLGHEHPDTLTSMNNLAGVLYWQGKYEEAVAMHKQTLAIREKVLGLEHPDMLTSMSNLAGMLDRQGKYEEAEAMHRQTLATRKKVLGHEHPSTLASMNNLALVLDSRGKYEEAEAMHRQTLATTKKVLGHEHPSTLTSMNNLALVLDSQGKYEGAIAMHKQTLATREKVLGHEHPDMLTSMNNLAGVLDRQGNYKEAEAIHRQTLATREKVLGHEHPDTLTSVHWLAHLLAEQCCYDESIALYDRACAAYSVLLGENHLTTRACCQHRSEAVVLQEQSWIVLAPATPDNGVSTHTGKISRLSRGLAKVGIKSSRYDRR
jgi:tetratricopeptide (TPR) repeat protein